jgi:predicted transcriptional regulator
MPSHPPARRQARHQAPRPEARRTITDVRVLAALSHPARVRLLNHLMEVGPSTATECASVAGVTPSACSYHLRHLQKFGLVERTDPTDGADGRERRWRAVSTGLSILPMPSRHDRAARTTMTGLLAEQVALQSDLATEFLGHALELDDDWQDAVEFSSYGLLVDAAELHEIVRRIDAILRPYLAVTRGDAPDAAEVAHVTLQAFPRQWPAAR